MAGVLSLEGVVRPFLPPVTRPADKAATVPPVPAEDVDRNLFSFSGSGQVINLAHSARSNASRSGSRETERTFDVMRVKNPEDPQQYVDVEVVTALKSLDWTDVPQTLRLAKPPETDNVERLEEDVKRTTVPP